jgi:hypothetical protein
MTGITIMPVIIYLWSELQKSQIFVMGYQDCTNLFLAENAEIAESIDNQLFSHIIIVS